MKKVVLLLFAVVSLISCQQKRDKIMAQVYYHKLYLSEIEENLPIGLSAEDSVAMVKDYIDNWVKEQLVLHEAERNLSLREKNFDKKMEDYRRSLLINAYYDKLVSDTSRFSISESEIRSFSRDFDKRYSVDKEIVRLNYVKLSEKSKLADQVKRILFDEDRRVNGKEELTRLLGDSVEYILDDQTWLYLDDIQTEVPFDIEEGDLKNNHQYVDKVAGGSRYLLVILDHKSRRSANETREEQAAVRMMLVNQRRQQFINKHVDELYRKALKDGSVTQ